MRKSIKFLTLFFLLIFNISCAQTAMKSITDAKKIELNKSEFIGKPLSFLLQNINLEIKSIIPTPNKNHNEISRISFLFVSKLSYKNSTSKNIDERPTRITINFNQNGDLLGERCTYNKPGCTEWTKQDEKNLGDLIVYDIYVSGKN